MTDPDTDPAHDLVEHPQDEPQPRIRLGTFLALLRVAAGRRGHASVSWHRFGFSYTVDVVREGGGSTVILDRDPGAIGGGDAGDRIRAALEP